MESPKAELKGGQKLIAQFKMPEVDQVGRALVPAWATVYTKDSGIQLHYEVMILMCRVKEQKVMGHVYPKGSLAYPSTEMWGSRAWSINQKERAIDKAKELAQIPEDQLVVLTNV